MTDPSDDPSVDPVAQLAALGTGEGRRALAAATEFVAAGTEPLAAVDTLRARGVDATLASAALTQARLRARAARKFGADAAHMYFTRTGLEQATRAGVARRRAARLAAAGVTHLVDLCCGIGADSIAAARAGLRVTAVDADPATTATADANVAALGLADRVTVHCRRAEDTDLTGTDAVFCDPARRNVRTGRRTFDPAAYAPPWEFLAALPRRMPGTVLKLAPGLDHARIPDDAEAEWVSVDRSLVEATLWYGPLATVPRRATLLAEEGPPLQPPAEEGSPVPAPGGTGDPSSAELTGTGTVAAPVGAPGEYLYDPDPAVVRASLVAEFAATVDGRLADGTIAYVYADQAHPTPYARRLVVREALPFSLKRLRSRLREAGVGRVEIMKRGSALDPDRLRQQLRLRGDRAATVVLTRVAGAPTALLCQPDA